MRTKTKGILIHLAFGLMLVVCPSVFAQQGHESAGDSKVQIPATVGEILAAVDLQVAALDKTIAANELHKVHLSAFEIRDLLLALPAKTSALPAQEKTALASDLKKIKQQAGLLDKFGDSGDLAQTRAVFVKMKDEIEKIKLIPGLNP